MNHKVIALRIKGKGKDLTIESLGQSPRGTRFIIGTVKIDQSGLENSALKRAVEEAALTLIPVPLPFE